MELRYLAIAAAFLVGCTSESSEPAYRGDSLGSEVREPDRACPWLGADDDTLPQQGEPCPDRVCTEGLTCVEYYGIAGPSGPLFTSCEIRCDEKDRCPCGQQCITIYDGPGEVCRPRFNDNAP